MQSTSTPSTFTAVNPYEFLTIMRGEVDISNFILLTAGLLNNILFQTHIEGSLKTKLQSKLEQIYHLYLISDYDRALFGLIKMTQQLQPTVTLSANNREEKIDLTEIILEKSKALSVIDVHKNDSKRFFETTFASLYLDTVLAQPAHIASVNKIYRAVMPQARSIETLEQAVELLANITDEVNDPAINSLTSATISSNEVYLTKDRIKKPGFEDYQVQKDTIYSSNKGVMRSLSPNFFNALTPMLVKIVSQIFVISLII